MTQKQTLLGADWTKSNYLLRRIAQCNKVLTKYYNSLNNAHILFNHYVQQHKQKLAQKYDTLAQAHIATINKWERELDTYKRQLRRERYV